MTQVQTGKTVDEYDICYSHSSFKLSSRVCAIPHTAIAPASCAPARTVRFRSMAAVAQPGGY
ncbi:hypothetical protein [Merismopedia glauca]|uniref:hypothetical protein n=1 Tax=Merismopedia glauca TaxID=292586 RepID=UPI0030D7FE1E